MFTADDPSPPCGWLPRIASAAAVVLTFVMTAACLAADAPMVKAGAAMVNITPPVGIGMAGYYFERGAQGTNDDLYANCLVLDSGGERVALISLDLISTTAAMVERARAEIEKVTGIPSGHVMISATHAHTGPVLPKRGPREDSQGGGADLAQRYSSDLPLRIAAGTKLALERLQPVRLATGRGREENLSYNRRFHMTDGTVGWNPGKLNPKIVKPAGPIDPEVSVLRIDPMARGDAFALYVNFAMHPDTVGGQFFSADYPGVLSRLLAACHGTNLVTVFANGACGNLNHIDVAWSDPQKGTREAQRIGTILTAAVLQTSKHLRPVPPGPLRVRRQIVKLPLPELAPDDVEKAKATVAKYDMKSNAGFMEKVQAYKVLDVAARNGQPLEVEVQVIALGDDLAWVSLPGEIFVELGLAIKKQSPFAQTFIAELANGSAGYIPNREAYLEGNYEVVSARCAPGSGEQLVEAALSSLRELHTLAERSDR